MEATGGGHGICSEVASEAYIGIEEKEEFTPGSGSQGVASEVLARPSFGEPRGGNQPDAWIGSGSNLNHGGRIVL